MPENGFWVSNAPICGAAFVITGYIEREAVATASARPTRAG